MPRPSQRPRRRRLRATLGSGAAGAPDPQVTCVAGRLGLRLDLPRLAAAVRASATPRGWAAPARAVPDPQTSYAGAALAHDWNDHRHDADLRRLVARWLRELAATPPGRLAGQLEPASYTVAVGAPRPDIAATADALDAVAAAAAARRTAVRPFTDASGTWRWPVGHPGENVRDPWSLYLGARLVAGRSTVPS